MKRSRGSAYRIEIGGKKTTGKNKKLTGFQVRLGGGRCGLQDGPGPRHSPVVPQQSDKPHALHRPYPVLQERSLTPYKPGPCRRKTPRSNYLQNAPRPCGRQCEPLLCGQDLALLAIDKPRSEVAVRIPGCQSAMPIAKPKPRDRGVPMLVPSCPEHVPADLLEQPRLRLYSDPAGNRALFVA